MMKSIASAPLRFHIAGLTGLVFTLTAGTLTALSAALVQTISTNLYDGGYGNDQVNGVVLDGDGVLVLAGSVKGPLSPEQHTTAWLIKQGPTGWTNTIEMGPIESGVKDDSNDSYLGVAVDSQNQVLVTGARSGAYWTADGYHQAMVVQKFDAAGNRVWERRENATGGPWSTGRSVVVDAQDNVWVAGNRFVDWGANRHNWAVWQFDRDGNPGPGASATGLIIDYNYSQNEAYPDIATGLALTPDGGVVVVGYRGVSAGNYDWHVRKYVQQPGWTKQWEDTLSGAAGWSDAARGVVVDGDGNVVVVGYENKGTDNGTGANYDWVIIQYDGTTGQRRWTQTYESAPGRSEYCTAVAMDGVGRLLVGGLHQDVAGLYHWRLARFDPADGSLITEQVWDTDQSQGINSVHYRHRQIAVGGWQNNGADNDGLCFVGAVPLPRIQRCVRETGGQLTLLWRNVFEPVTVEYQPLLGGSAWQTVAGPLVSFEWTGSPPADDAGFFRLKEP